MTEHEHLIEHRIYDRTFGVIRNRRIRVRFVHPYPRFFLKSISVSAISNVFMFVIASVTAFSKTHVRVGSLSARVRNFSKNWCLCPRSQKFSCRYPCLWFQKKIHIRVRDLSARVRDLTKTCPCPRSKMFGVRVHRSLRVIVFIRGRGSHSFVQSAKRAFDLVAQKALILFICW